MRNKRSDRYRLVSWAATLAVPAVTVLVAPTAAGSSQGEPTPPTGCTIERLPEPDRSVASEVTAGDPTGRYLVGRGYPASPWANQERQVMLWSDGEPTEIDIDGIDQQLRDVNASGVAVGGSEDISTYEGLLPWVVRDGEVSALPGVESGSADGINDRGDVIGYRSDEFYSVWWPAGEDGPVDLPVPDGATNPRAGAIDEDGTIVGGYDDETGEDHGYVWFPDGTTMELEPPGDLDETGFRDFDIRNGWVIGPASGPDGIVIVRWHLPSGDVQVFPQFAYPPREWYATIKPPVVNANGWIAGMDRQGRALVVADEVELTLPGLADHDEPVDVATAISDDGRSIAGRALDANGDPRAVRWSCE